MEWNGGENQSFEEMSKRRKILKDFNQESEEASMLAENRCMELD